MIEFPIYNSDKTHTLILQIVILGITLVAIHFLFPSIELSVVLILTIILYLIFTEKKKHPAGKIYFSPHQIKVVTEKSEIQIDLSSIDRLELIYSGYKGKRIAGDFIPRLNTFSGIDNYINIRNDKYKCKYKFFVENELQENDIIELIRDWEIQGYDISNIKINK